MTDHKLDPTVKLIGLVGPARCGKDTFAQIMAELFATATAEEAYDWIISTESYAAPIKSMVAMLLDFFGICSIQNRGKMLEYVDGDLKEIFIPTIGMSPRGLMQTLGTDWGRHMVDPNIWLNCMAQRLPQYNEAKNAGHKGAVVIVTDVRFDNEAAVIRELGGKVVYITTGDRVLEEVKERGHISESGVDKRYIDVIIDNSGTMEQYINTVKIFIEGQLGFKLESEEFGITTEEIMGIPTIVQGPPKEAAP